MTPRQAKLFKQIYSYNARFPEAPFLVDGPRRGKLAADMAKQGWLTDHGPVGVPVSLGNAYFVTPAGCDAYNAALTANKGGFGK